MVQLSAVVGPSLNPHLKALLPQVFYFSLIASTLSFIFYSKCIYYMANPILGKSLCSDWFFLGQDFAARTVSMETVQSAYSYLGAGLANSKFATKTAKNKCE